jgi:zinc D-Ala-D-Ala carboxypeptidase
MSWKNFKLEEFSCKHCGKNEINHKLIDKLQLLRDDLGFPLVISSGYRCSEHPIEAKKSKPGTHAEGIAVDIAVSHEKALEVLYKGIAHGFKGIGVNQKGNGRFIHLDIGEMEDGRPRPHLWSY